MTFRKWEIGICWFASVLSAVFIGGFSVVILQMPQGTFETTLFPLLRESDSGLILQESYEGMRTLGAWFGMTVMVVLVLAILAGLCAARISRLIVASICYVLAGLCLLLGTQYLGFPLAFCYFVAAALCVIRNRRLMMDEEKENSENL
ncbi:hypothetical protein OIN60_13765 [Paenibacillus sp. P96]|uniref:DUF4064 domain-containing protein n=1 Tax=Paenibacillus zeirhizosphaerae TaxID=2987519 RepID=A0ABT9FSY9_9BACL|nr:hypothetical protein [Paenibacillus sp. P96]MDP4097838.1 hypothetical protein [Paenibacillus sp. P96]